MKKIISDIVSRCAPVQCNFPLSSATDSCAPLSHNEVITRVLSVCLVVLMLTD